MDAQPRSASEGERWLRLLAHIQQRPVIVAVVGVTLELAIMALAGSDDAIRGVRGIGGETALSLAVIGALFGGPVVGVLMAAAG